MAKPTSLPRWASGASAQVVEPTEGKKDTGWVPLEKPPAQYENWLRKLTYDWLSYVNGLANEAFTWAAKHTFAAGVRLSSISDPVTPADGDVWQSSGLLKARLAGSTEVLATRSWAGLTQGALAMGSGWTSETATGQEPRCWKDQTGLVRCRGRVIYSGGALSSILTFPAGFRPSGFRVLPAGVVRYSDANPLDDSSLDPFPVIIGSDGVLRAYFEANRTTLPVSANPYVDISGIMFHAE